MRTSGLVALGLLLVSAIPVPLTVTAQSRQSVIDMHMHVLANLPRTRTGQPLPRPCWPEPCSLVGGPALGGDDLLRATLQAMDRHNVVLGFLSGASENVYKWVAAAPKRFVATPLVGDPTDVDIAALRSAWPETIGLGIQAIEAAAFLSAEQKRDILYNNAARFLRLDDKSKASR